MWTNDPWAIPFRCPLMHKSALKRYQNRRIRNPKKPDSDHQINERMMARWTRHVGLFTAGLLVVGVFTAGIFWRQLDVMQDQLDEMQRTFAADRAYIFVDNVARNKSDDIITGYKIEVTFRNFGRTPAIITQVSNNGCQFYKAPPSPFVSDDKGSLPISVPIGAGDPVGPFPAAVSATTLQIEMAKAGAGSVRCIYNLTYEDVRGNSHVAGVCLLFGIIPNYVYFCPERKYREAYQKAN